MRVFVAGASGAIGRRLVPLLVEAEHDVLGSTRSPRNTERIAADGAEPVLMDGLDPESVRKAVLVAAPEVVVHQLTALPASVDPRRFDSDLAQTNLLRTRGTDNLLAAATEAGVRRFVAQSYAGWPNERTGGPVKTEEDPLDPNPARASRKTLAAIRYVEQRVTEASGMEGVVLRYGAFYGPGTSIAKDGEVVEMVRRRRFPVVGGGRGVWSFVHIDDAAAATLRAVADGPTGIFNVTDDEPATVASWLPHLAEVVGARPPMRLPAWLARPLLGEHGVSLMTQVRGSSNARARAELGWDPAWPTWREGFATGLG